MWDSNAFRWWGWADSGVVWSGLLMYYLSLWTERYRFASVFTLLDDRGKLVS